MMKIFFIVAAVIVLAASSEDCDYVRSSNSFMVDGEKVKNCFNSHAVPMEFVEAIITQLERAGSVYPSVDIAKNPPENMRTFFKPVDFVQDLETLKTTLRASEGITSQVFRPLSRFIGQFYDGHFNMNFVDTDDADNLFANVVYAFPFEWVPVLTDDGMKVYLSENDLTSVLGSDFLNTIKDKKTGLIPVKTIDGINAFEYFRGFHNETSAMKSLQAIIYSSRMKGMGSLLPAKLLTQPLDDDEFGTHEIVFTDDSKLDFSFIFAKKSLDTRTWTTRDDLNIDWNSVLKRRNEIRDDQCKNVYVTCETTPVFNVLAVPTFMPMGSTPEQIEAEASCFLVQLMTCTDSFDQNDLPILISLLGNGGGSELLSRIMSFLLFPDYDIRLVKAIRKTDQSQVLKNQIVSNVAQLSTSTKTCQTITDATFDSFLKDTVTDDLGNGVKHERSNKFVVQFPIASQELKEEAAITKHPRKPTDVVIVTDGTCASVCSMFINTVLDFGQAIVAGVGTPYDGNTRFTASQIAANTVTSLTDIFPDLAEDCEKFGIQTGVAIIEHYPVSKDLDEVIPYEYTLNEINGYLGDVYTFPYITDENTMMAIAQNAYALTTISATQCDPRNKRLFFVTDQCSSNDKNAVKSGYACGANGEWDTNDCRIALCKPGYI